jgi:hypothetical protein
MGMYYTPKEIVEIIEPASGDAADMLSNPPFSAEHRVHWTAGVGRKLWSLIGWVVRSLRRQ